jgi:hypothetical protein
MTTITIKIAKPDFSAGYKNSVLYKAMAALPMGVETHVEPNGEISLVHIKGKRQEIAYDASEKFLNAFDGEIFGAEAQTGKRIEDLLADEYPINPTPVYSTWEAIVA